MNVFVLGTGRCGTTTFIRACYHVSNFTAAHESRMNLIGAARLAYPANHIEADNRLSWMLGRLESAFGDEAVYIHQMRSEEAVVQSYLRRWKAEHSIVYGYRTSIVPHPPLEAPPAEVVRDMVRTVRANIDAFMRGKSRTATVRLEHAREDFPCCWELAGFKGDLAAALQEWTVAHNASAERPPGGLTRVARLPAKLGRIARKLPGFIDRA